MLGIWCLNTYAERGRVLLVESVSVPVVDLSALSSAELQVRGGFPIGFPVSSMRLYLENPRILRNPYLYLEVADDGHDSEVQVGRLNVRDVDSCGKFTGLKVCTDVETHTGVVLDGVDFTGKVAVKPVCLWCNDLGCPRCFLNGYVPREARRIENRLQTLVERFPDAVIEHVVVSPCEADRGLPPDVLREKCRMALFRRGWLGGCEIPHGRVIDKESQKLVWHYHLHTLGILRGNSFEVCRNCGSHSKEDCLVCNGFKGIESREYEKDGYIVTVKGRRKSIGGTAGYQLSHATFHVGLEKRYLVTWSGVASNNKFASGKVLAVDPCPVCGVVGVRNLMEKKPNWSDEVFVKDVRDPRFKGVFAVSEFNADGLPSFPDAVGGRRD